MSDMNKSRAGAKSRLRENIESLIVAVGLALIIRASVVEAFVVPTGSMAPTIYGKHIEVTCGTCGHKFALGWKKGRWHRPPPIECPVCGKSVNVGLHSYSAGDRLLVNKFVHKMKGLSRWQIVVFKYPGPDPEKKGRNYIKRLVGLPGDSVRIKNGDLYVNGKIERKPLGVQRNMWIKVYENNFRGDLWKELWSAAAGTYRVEDGILWADGSAPGLLRFRYRIDDNLFYNASRGVSTSDVVADTKVLFEAEIGDGAGLLVRLLGNDSRFRFDVRAGREKSSITDGDGGVVWEGALGLSAGTHVVECSNVDSALYLVVDGKLRASIEYPPLDPGPYPSAGVALGATGGRVGFRRVALFRDVYYCALTGIDTKNNAVFFPCRLSKRGLDTDSGKKIENEYFMLGDNSRSSSDSRDWGKVRESYIRGKAVVRFWPPLRMGIIR